MEKYSYGSGKSLEDSRGGGRFSYFVVTLLQLNCTIWLLLVFRHFEFNFSF